MTGVEPILRPTVRARLAEPLSSPPGRRSYLRATLNVEEGAYVVRPMGGPGSHLIAALAAANALIVVPEQVTDLEPGAAVTVMVLERRHH
jgi:molybdopterin molybdotransferase